MAAALLALAACGPVPADPVQQIDRALGGDRLLVRACLPLDVPRPKLGACRMER